MDDDRAGGLSRRELITGPAVVGAAALLRAQAASADAPPPDDSTLLTKALQFERLSVLAYAQLSGLAGLSAHERRVLRLLERQDRSHVRALQSIMLERGLTLPAPPSGPQAVDQALSTKGMSGHLAAVSTLKQAVALLLDIEALAQGGYYMVIRDIREPAIAQRGAEILANEAQHAMLLTQLVSTEITQTVPGWYVTGVT